MVTFHYFLNYFVLLVLQSSVLYAQEQSQSQPTTVLPDPSPSPLPNTTQASVQLKNETLPALDPKATAANATSDKEFPKSPLGDKQVIYLKETVQTPKLDSKPVNTSKTAPDTKVLTKCNMTSPDKSANIDTEVPDLLNSNETKDNIDKLLALASNEGPMSSSLDDNQKIDTEVERIDDGQNTEDILRAPSRQQADVPGVPLVQGQLAAILAAVFVIISVAAYIALLSWRRYLENRYGDRQMLVDNELNERDDIRHFSI